MITVWFKTQRKPELSFHFTIQKLQVKVCFRTLEFQVDT